MSVDAKSWAQQFRRLSDESPTMQAMGKYFTCSYMLDMGDFKTIIRMHDGKIDEINTDPAPLGAYDFAIRTSPETWRKFGTKTPPMCHGICAATFREEMKLEGELLVILQNLRNITIQVELLTPPSAGQEAADQIDGGTFIAMNDISHFPMSENYPVFKAYLKQALDLIASRKGGAGPQTGGKNKNGKQQHRSTREVRHGHPVHQ